MFSFGLQMTVLSVISGASLISSPAMAQITPGPVTGGVAPPKHCHAQMQYAIASERKLGHEIY